MTFELKQETDRHVLVSVAMCLEEDALASVFSLCEVKHEAYPLEEVNWKRLFVYLCVHACLCVYVCGPWSLLVLLGLFPLYGSIVHSSI